MQDLRVIGVEDDTLLLASETGERFRLPVDDVVTSRLRTQSFDSTAARKLSPKEIQAHIRSGMSAQDVATITGAELEYIQRFEGPVLAERDYVIQSALEVPVLASADADPLGRGSTFGSVIMNRLHELNASGQRWASWKEEPQGWIVKLSFTSSDIDHDARWKFDPKKSTLSPANSEATALSQQGEITGSLIPRLRAVTPRDRVADSSRFDSGAFSDLELVDADIESPGTTEPAQPAPFRRTPSAAQTTTPAPPNQTADLLDALRRRRGERESTDLSVTDEARSAHPSTGSIRLVEGVDAAKDENRHAGPPTKSSRKGRASMPSWDEIVFGARSDDDPA